jgi:hypothetical protein
MAAPSFDTFCSSARRLVACLHQLRNTQPQLFRGGVNAHWLHGWEWVPLAEPPFAQVSALTSAGGFLRRTVSVATPIASCRPKAMSAPGSVSELGGIHDGRGDHDNHDNRDLHGQHHHNDGHDGEADNACDVAHSRDRERDGDGEAQRDSKAALLGMRTGGHDEDPACVTLTRQCCFETFELTACFNHAYCVPVLYVRGLTGLAGGRDTGAIPCIFRRPPLSSQEEQEALDSGGHTASPELHPLSGQPCFMVNPCRTHVVLAVLAGGANAGAGAGARIEESASEQTATVGRPPARGVGVHEHGPVAARQAALAQPQAQPQRRSDAVGSPSPAWLLHWLAIVSTLFTLDTPPRLYRALLHMLELDLEEKQVPFIPEQ